MAKKLELDMSRCSACGACRIACMDQNDIDLSTGVRPFRVVFRQDMKRDGNVEYYSISCMHCDNAPCVTACPSGCLYKDKETGLTLFDTTYCIGCHSCRMACPFGAPTFGPDNKLRKCDGCIDRQRAGLLPACVKGCTFGALTLKDTADIVPGDSNSLVNICDELVKSQK